MVHALKEIHRLLKPGGLLIDIHPASEPSPIEIHQNENIDLVGHLKVHQWCLDYQQADNALTEIIQRGLYSLEKKDEFDTLTYYETAEEMGASFKESIHKYARDARSAEEAALHAGRLAAKVEKRMQDADSGTKLAMREREHISWLKPT